MPFFEPINPRSPFFFLAPEYYAQCNASNRNKRNFPLIQEHDVPEPLKIVIYRTLQEALNNVVKHSKAPEVLLHLRKAKTGIQLAIRDSGQGFDLREVHSRKGTTKGLGLDSMRERVELSGGSFSVESSKGAGAVITAEWATEPVST